jgi:hypothetical protein
MLMERKGRVKVHGREQHLTRNIVESLLENTVSLPRKSQYLSITGVDFQDIMQIMSLLYIPHS